MFSLKWTMSHILLALFCVAAAAPQASPGAGRWTTLAKLPEPRQEHSTVAISDCKIAVVGGVTAVFNGTTQIGFATTDLVHMYDIASNTWSTATPTPYKVNHANVATHDGRIYLLGGLVDAQNPPGPNFDWVASGESHVYNLTTDSWTELEPMPPGTERGSAIIAVHGEMIYLAGGMRGLNSGYQDSAMVVTSFNTTSRKWQRLPAIAANIPEGRQHGVGSVVGDILYVSGGRWFSQEAVRGEVFMLDLDNQGAGWKISANHMPVPRGGLSGAVIRNRLITFGGEGNPNGDSGVFDETEAFDVQAQRWTELAPMAVPRHGTSAAAAGNKIYIPGGGLQQDGKPVMINGVLSYLHTSDHFDVFSI